MTVEFYGANRVGTRGRGIAEGVKLRDKGVDRGIACGKAAAALLSRAW